MPCTLINVLIANTCNLRLNFFLKFKLIKTKTRLNKFKCIPNLVYAKKEHTMLRDESKPLRNYLDLRTKKIGLKIYGR